MRKKVVIFAFLTLLTAVLSFSEISIVTSIPPLGYAIQQIGGKNVNVEVLTHAGDNPHTYTLTPRQAFEISKADLFVSLGLAEDKWIKEKVLSINPSIEVINATEGLQEFLIGEGGNYNPHVWLDVKLYEMMCTNIYYSLAKKYPSKDDFFAMNYAKFMAKLEQLNRFIATKMKPYRGRDFIAQHPAWDYFARAYALGREYSLENDSGQSITPRQYEKVIDTMKSEHIRDIIGDPVTPSTMAKTLASQTGARIVEVNPIYTFDYFVLMKTIAEKFVEAFSGE